MSLAAVLGLMLLLLAAGASCKKSEHVFNLKMAVQLTAEGELPALDPARVVNAEQAILIENLYSALLEFDSKGALRPILAESWSIKGNVITFKIRENARTSLGNAISALDVASSLKRHILLRKGTHGSLQDLIPCPAIEKIEDYCSGIEVINSKEIRLRTKRKEFIPLLLPLLAATEFYIIPDRAIDRRKNLALDVVETTGPYFFSKKDELSANEHNPHIKSDSPKKVYLVNRRGRSSRDLLLSGEVDFVPTMNGIYKEDADALRERGFSIHETQKMALAFIFFPESSEIKLTRRQRIAMGVALRQEYLKEYADRGLERAREFLPSFHPGKVSLQQRRILDEEFEAGVHGIRVGRPISLMVSASSFERMKKMASRLYWLKVEIEGSPVGSIDPDGERSEVMILYADIFFNEDFSLINYYSNVGIFDASKAKKSEWLKTFLADEGGRARIIQKMHFEALHSARVVPIGTMPYFSAGRPGLSLNQPTVNAASMIWNIRHER